MKPKDLRELGERLFTKRAPLVSLWQEQAENFYPERADFTVSRCIGEDFAANLMTSYPIIVRRDLGDAFSTMMRDGEWFQTATDIDDEELDNDSRAWLQWATRTQRNAMYDPVAKFDRATKEGDHDYAGFGQNVISCEFNRRKTTLLYRCWHLRDVVWFENDEGDVAGVMRRWKPTARDLVRMFGDKVHANIKKAMTQSKPDPFKEFPVMHIVVEADLCDDEKYRTPYVSIYYDIEHDCVIEKAPVWTLIYNVARWQTVSGSQYANSPATVAALPEARLLQAMTLTLLEAGEKANNPPMIGVAEAFRSDMQLFAGGFTAVDAAYDERLGEVLRPLNPNKSDVRLGMEMVRDSRSMIAEAFYLNKLSLPHRAPEMTAYEVGQRVQQWIRDAAPLFRPTEMSYNGGICSLTFETLYRNGGLGSVFDMPRQLRGADIRFRFQSPLHEAIERKKAGTFMEAKAMLAEAVAIDPACRHMLKAPIMLRDALNGIGVPARWQAPDVEVEQGRAQDAAQAEAAQLLAKMQQGADVADTIASAQKQRMEAMAQA